MRQGNCRAGTGPGAVNLAKACWAGATAQIYLNTTLPSGTTYEQVRTAIVEAFQNLTDPAHPGKQVVAAGDRHRAEGARPPTGAAPAIRSISLRAPPIRSAENDYMVSGGDGYLNLVGRASTRDLMDQVLADYVLANSPLRPAIRGRIVCTSGSCPPVTP